jgi:uncharacterized membrane protein
MAIGLILLAVVGVLILFGVAQRVLDRMRLTDKQALLLVALMFLGGLIPEIPLGNMVRINIGGAIVPLGVCVYLLIRADTAKERVRAIVASIFAGGAVFLLGRLLPSEPTQTVMDPNWLYGLTAGVLGYIFGRSRRGAFIAGILGVMLADITQARVHWSMGINQALPLGGAGALDAIVLAGLIGVLLAELVGEVFERMSRGTKKDESRAFEHGDIVKKEREK